MPMFMRCYGFAMMVSVGVSHSGSACLKSSLQHSPGIYVNAFGYQLGMNGHRLPVLVAILIAVWTTMLVVILDLGAPRLGFMRTNGAVYDWILEGMSDRSSGPSASITH